MAWFNKLVEVRMVEGDPIEMATGAGEASTQVEPPSVTAAKRKGLAQAILTAQEVLQDCNEGEDYGVLSEVEEKIDSAMQSLREAYSLVRGKAETSIQDSVLNTSLAEYEMELFEDNKFRILRKGTAHHNTIGRCFFKDGITTHFSAIKPDGFRYNKYSSDHQLAAFEYLSGMDSTFYKMVPNWEDGTFMLIQEDPEVPWRI